MKSITPDRDFNLLHDGVDVAGEDLLEVFFAQRDVGYGQVFEVSIYFVEFDIEDTLEFFVLGVLDFEAAYSVLDEKVEFDYEYSERGFLLVGFEVSLQLIQRMLIQLPLLLLLVVPPKNPLDLQRRIKPFHFLRWRRVIPIIDEHTVFGVHIADHLLVDVFKEQPFVEPFHA